VAPKLESSVLLKRNYQPLVIPFHDYTKHPKPPCMQTILPLIDPDLHGPWIYPCWTARNTVNKSNPLNLILVNIPAKVRQRRLGNNLNCLIQQA